MIKDEKKFVDFLIKWGLFQNSFTSHSVLENIIIIHSNLCDPIPRRVGDVR